MDDVRCIRTNLRRKTWSTSICWRIMLAEPVGSHIVKQILHNSILWAFKIEFPSNIVDLVYDSNSIKIFDSSRNQIWVFFGISQSICRGRIEILVLLFNSMNLKLCFDVRWSRIMSYWLWMRLLIWIIRVRNRVQIRIRKGCEARIRMIYPIWLVIWDRCQTWISIQNWWLRWITVGGWTPVARWSQGLGGSRFTRLLGHWNDRCWWTLWLAWDLFGQIGCICEMTEWDELHKSDFQVSDEERNYHYT